MKKILSVVLAVILGLIPYQVIAAGKTACEVNPNPVVLGTEFSVTANLQPLKAYDIRIDQDDQFGHHDDASGIFTDENGLFSYTYEHWDNPRDFLTEGDFRVGIRPSNATGLPKSDKGSGGANCIGTVIS